MRYTLSVNFPRYRSCTYYCQRSPSNAWFQTRQRDREQVYLQTTNPAQLLTAWWCPSGISIQYSVIVSHSVCVILSVARYGRSGLRRGLGERRAYIWTDLGARESGETGADLPLWNNRRTLWIQNWALYIHILQCSFISSDLTIIKSGITGDRRNWDFKNCGNISKMVGTAYLQSQG